MKTLIVVTKQKQAGRKQHSCCDNFLLYSHKKASWQLNCLGLLFKLGKITDTYWKQSKSFLRNINISSVIAKKSWKPEQNLALIKSSTNSDLSSKAYYYHLSTPMHACWSILYRPILYEQNLIKWNNSSALFSNKQN